MIAVCRLQINFIHYFFQIQIEEGAIRPIALMDDKSHKFNHMKFIVQEMEREILKELGFELYQITWNEQPHRLMYFYINLFKPTQSNLQSSFQNLTRIAFNYLNDSYKTNLCLHLPFQMIVACCIYLAFRQTGVEMPKIAWWTIMETSLQNLKMGAGKIYTLYNQFKQLPKFKDCLDIINELAQKKNITLPFNSSYHELPEKQTSSNPMTAVAEAILKSKMKGQNQMGINSSAERIQSSEQLDKSAENGSVQNNGVSSLRDITRDSKHSKFSLTGRSTSKSKERRKKSRSNSRKKTHKRKQSHSHSKSRDRNNDRNKDRKEKDKKHSYRRSKSRERRNSKDRRSKSRDRRSRSKHHRDRSRSQKDKKRRSKSRDRKRKDKSESKSKSTTISSKNEGKIDKFSSQINSEKEITNGKHQDNFAIPTNGNAGNTQSINTINENGQSNKAISITPEQSKQPDKHSPTNQKKSRRERDDSSSKVKEGKDKKDRKKSKSRSRSHHKKSKKYHSPNDRESKRKRSKDRKKDYKRSRSNSGERSSKFSAQTTNRVDNKKTPSPVHRGDKFSSMITEKSNDFSSVQVRGPSSDSKQKNTDPSQSFSSNGLLHETDKNEDIKMQFISQNQKNNQISFSNLNNLKQRIEQIKNASMQSKNSEQPVQHDPQRKFDFLQKLKTEMSKSKVEEQIITPTTVSRKPTLDINSQIADKLKQYKPQQNKINSSNQQNKQSSDDEKKSIDNDDSKSNDSQENETELLMKLRKQQPINLNNFIQNIGEQMKKKAQQGTS